MIDPKRLSMGSDCPDERLLLRASRISAPHGSKERAMLVASSALGASGAVASGAGASKGTALGMAKAGLIASLKWVGILGLAGIGTVAAALALREVRERRAPTVVEMASASASKSPAARRTNATPKQTAETDDEWTPAPVDPITLVPASAEVAAARSAPAPTLAASIADAGTQTASTLPAELALLEQARGAIAAGDPARSLSVLDRYPKRFPQGSMAPEATMLRIEALVKVGDRGAATRTADTFLASDPESPYAARVRSLLGTSNP